jgi:hypothetical protein
VFVAVINMLRGCEIEVPVEYAEDRDILSQAASGERMADG